MGLKRKRCRCGWRTLWVLAVCMVEIGRVRVKTGNAPIEQKISAYPPQANICVFVSTSLETKRAAWRPSQGSGRPKCKREGMAEDRFGSDSDVGGRNREVRFTPDNGPPQTATVCPKSAHRFPCHKPPTKDHSATAKTCLKT